jgi:hypothetical protein
MTDYAVFEISLHRHDAGSYRVEANLRLPGEVASRQHWELLPQFDFSALEIHSLDPDAYGQTLTWSLFASESLRAFWVGARAAAAAQNPPALLRLRLRIEPSLPELHALRWETLHDPSRPGLRLAADENVLFSRYLSSRDWRTVRPLSRGDLKALVVVASPANLADYALESLDVHGELQRARDSLGNIPVTALCSGPGPDCRGRPTVRELFAHLRDGFDILYLVCHGAFVRDQAVLWLEDEEGNVEVVTADERPQPDGSRRPGLVAKLDQLPQLPRLVVLPACQTAARGGRWTSAGEGALGSLGPRLIEIGVPAVLAMQDLVTVETVGEFMPVFFEELQQHGHIDRAMAVARRAVLHQYDWWVPVLFTRLESGQLFADEPEGGADESSTPDVPDSDSYDPRTVRDLLMAAFSADELRRLVLYSSNKGLRRLMPEFSPGDSLTTLVDKTIEYCMRRDLLPELLKEVSRESPRQYARFEGRLRA